MDLHHLASEFERASIGLQDNQARKSAEQFITEITESKDALLICKIVLDNSQNEMALFQASSVISKRISIDFFIHTKEDISSLRDYLFSYCLGKPNLPSHTRETLLQSIAIIFKFSWIRDQDFDVKIFLDKVISLPFDQIFEKYLVILLIKALLNEFLVNNATKVGLSYEMHKKCKEQFQESYLLKIFITTGTILDQCLKDEAKIDQVYAMKFPLAISQLLDIILSWDFEETDDIFDEKKNRPAISYNTNFVKNFPNEWRPYFTSPHLIDLLFLLHNKMVASGEEIISLDAVLISLSGISKEHFQSDSDRLGYIKKYINHLLDKFESFNINSENKEPALIGIAQIIDGLMNNISLKELLSIPESFKFIEQICNITLKTLQQSVYDGDECFFEDTFDYFLEALSNLGLQLCEEDSYSYTQPNDNQGDQVNNITKLNMHLQGFSIALLKTYLEIKISNSIDSMLKGEKSDDLESKDWYLYIYQLEGIATLARSNPEATLRYLYINLVTNLQNALEQMNQFNLNSNPEDKTLSKIFEHIHWYIVASGFILADEVEGETPIIPITLNTYSIQQVDQPNDMVILLPSLITNILSSFTIDPNDIKSQLCSPELAETIFWFFQRWARTYLFPNKENYFNLSDNILSVFGTSSHEKAGRLVLDVLLDKIHKSYLMWKSRPVPMGQIANLLHVLCSRQESRVVLYNSPKFLDIASSLIENMEVSSRNTNSNIVQSILFVATGSPNKQLQDSLLSFLDNRLMYLVKGMMSLIERGDENIPNYLHWAINIIEMLQGYGLACDLTNSITIYRSYSKYLVCITQFASAYKNSKEMWVACFYFISVITNRMDMFDFSAQDLDIFTQFIYSIYNTYSSNFEVLKIENEKADVLDDPYHDLEESLIAIISLMQLENENGKDSESVKNSLIQVIFYAITCLLGNLEQFMLEYKSISSRFVQLVALAIQQYPDKLSELQTEHLDFVLKFLLFAIESSDFETAQFAYNCIFLFGVNFFSSSSDSMRNYMQMFLKNILATILSKKVNWNLIESISDALIMMLASQMEYFKQLHTSLIEQYCLPNHELAFSECLNFLITSVENNFELTNRGLPAVTLIDFRECVTEFIRKVRQHLKVDNN